MAYFIIDPEHNILKKCGSHKKAVVANQEIPGRVLTEKRYRKEFGETIIQKEMKGVFKEIEEVSKRVVKEIEEVSKVKKTRDEIKADEFAKRKEKNEKYRKIRDKIFDKIPVTEKIYETPMTSKADVEKRIKEEGGKLQGIVPHPSGQYYGIYTK